MRKALKSEARPGVRWPCTVRRLDVLPGQRILAVSDIHGNLPFFRGLMDRVELSRRDVLILLGDMLEKGAESLALLRHIMTLEETHQVYALCGNCDGLILRFFEGDEWDKGFFQGYIPIHPECTLRQMADEIGFTDWENLPALRRALRTHFAREWQWLRALPTVIETEHHVFVHGGVSTLDGMEELDAWKCMKYDDFLGQDVCFEKYVVVGHWPVTLYRPTLQCARPLIDKERKILSIDGGCVLKLDGQLNALMVEGDEPEQFYWTCYDGLPTAVALDGQAPSKNPLNIRWGHSEVEILAPGEELTLCRHIESGRELSILTRFLHSDGKRTWCEDATDYLLPVSPGDVLSVSERVRGGVLAKKDGVSGWYWGRLKENEQ